MAETLGLTEASSVLEELYFADALYAEQIMRDMPTLLAMEHKTDGGAEGWHQPIRYTNPLGFGPNYTAALANNTASDYTKFVGDFKESIGFVRVAGSLLRRAKANKSLLVDHLETEMNGAMYQIKQHLGIMLFGNGGGYKAKESGVWTSGNDLVLRPGEAYHFDVGEVIQTSTDDGNSGSVDSGTTFVTAVDGENDTITVDNIGDISAFAQGDFIFKNGYFGQGMSGLSGWIPVAADLGTFRGVDQTLNPNRLAGVRHTGATGIYQSLLKARQKVRAQRQAATTDLVVLNDDDFSDLEIEMEARKRIIERETMKGKGGQFAGIGVEAIRLHGADIVSDAACPRGTAFILSRNTWKYRTCGDLLEKVDEDGLTFVRKDGADTFEARIWTCGDTICSNPGANGRVALP